MSILTVARRLFGAITLWKGLFICFFFACVSDIASAVIIDKATDGCGGIFSGSFGNFTSPGYPNKYAENLNCKWSINVDENSRIHIDFIYIEIEAGDGCLYDYLLFRDGLEPMSPALAKICHAHTTTIKSTGSAVTVLFVTDSTQGFRGFHLTWKAVPKVPLVQPEGTSITSPWIGIATPENLRQIDSGITESLWAVDKKSNVYVYANGIWDIVQGRMAYITSGPSVIGTSEDGFVWHRKGVSSETPKGTDWERIDTSIPMIRVESGRVGIAVGLDLLGNAYQLQMDRNKPTGVIWKLHEAQADPLIDISCGSYACWFTSVTGAVFVAPDIGLASLTKSSTPSLKLQEVASPFSVKQVAVGFASSLWVIASNGDIYKRKGVNILRPDGVSWERVDRVSFEKITIGLMGVYGLTKSGVIIAMEETKCGGILTAKKGMLASPSYPNIYPANLTCLWVIRVPDAIGIVIQFMKLVGIGRTSICRDDFLVSFEDGKYPSDSEGLVECGDKVEDKYFQGNEIWIEFNSGMSDRGFGFQAVYDAWFDPSTTKQGSVERPTSQVFTERPTTQISTRASARTSGPTTQISTRPSARTSESTSRITSDAKRSHSSMTSPESTMDTQSMMVKDHAESKTNTSSSTRTKTEITSKAPSKFSTSQSVSTSPSIKPSTQAMKTQTSVPVSMKVSSNAQDQSSASASTARPQKTETQHVMTSAPSTRHETTETTPKKPGPTTPKTSSTDAAKTTQDGRTSPDLSSKQPSLPTSLATTSTVIAVPKGWQLVASPERMAQVAVSILDAVWSLDRDGAAYVLINDMWRKVGNEKFKSLAVGKMSVWGVTDDNEIAIRQNVTRRNPSGTSWKVIDGEDTRKVIVGPWDEVFAIRSDGTLLGRSGQSDKSSYGTQWEDTGRKVLDASIGSYGIYFIANDNSLYIVERQPTKNASFNFANAQYIDGALKGIMAGHGSSLWGVELDDTLVKREQVDGSKPYGIVWKQLDGKTNDISPGFLSVYRVLADGKVVRKQDNTCGGILSSSIGRIKTPNYPSNYPANANCLWLVDIPHTKMVQLFIEDFDIEYHPFCTLDRMVTYVPGNEAPAFDCGTIARNKTILGNSFTIEFDSNDKVNLRGFNIKYTAYDKIDPVQKSTKTPTASSCDIKCGVEYDPVCGSDGETYDNDCIMRTVACISRKIITVVSKGKCIQKESICDIKCGIQYEPVCGSDGETYENDCVLRAEACVSKKVITVASKGECNQSESNCDVKCGVEYNPVCGSNGKTYANDCVLKTVACVSRKIITVASKGECKHNGSTCNKKCGVEYDPVCGSDGKTYASDCALKTVACISKKTITVAGKGECSKNACNMRCDMKYEPICGTDGKTYANACVMKVQSCLSKKIINVASKGECAKEDSPANWSLVSSSPKMRVVSVSRNEMIWALDFTGKPFILMNMTWKSIGTEEFTSLTVDELGAWAVGNNNMLKYRQGVTKMEPGGVTWVTVGTNIKKVATGPMKNILAIRGDGTLLARTGITPNLPIGIAWKDTGKKAKDVSIGNYGVWIVDESGELEFSDVKMGDDMGSISLRWRNVDKGFMAVAAGHGASLWGILSNGTVVQRQGITSGSPTGNEWRMFDGATTSVSPGIHNVYRTLANGNVVRRQDNKCGDILSFMKGEFKTPNYPMAYPENSNCLWLIRVNKGKGIQISYDDFELEESSSCRNDRVTTIAPSIASPSEECGTSYVTKVLTGTTAMVEFVSNEMAEKKGFSSKYNTLFMIDVETTTKAKMTTTERILPVTSIDSTDASMKLLLTENIARGMPTKQSSTSFSSDPSKAVDGNSNPDVRYQSCTATRSEYGPWWRVDLLRPRTIAKVKLTSPKESENLKNIEVRVGNVDNAHKQNNLCAYVPGGIASGEQRDITCSGPISGRYVYITVRTTVPDVLSLCEVEVYAVKQDRKCGGLLEATSGIFATPNYPSPYPNEVVCLWVIRVPEAKSIVVTFESFDVGQETGDFLAYSASGIYPTNEQPLLIENPGRKEFTFLGDTALFEFVSDGKQTSRGFYARYDSDLRRNKQATERPTTPQVTQPPTPFSGCGGTFSQETGSITTPNFPNKYPRNSDCTWFIEVPSGKRISLSLSEIDVEEAVKCKYDFIKIGEGSIKGENVKETHCGKINSLITVSAGNKIWIQLFSDASQEGFGFQARWTSLMASTTEVLKTTIRTTQKSRTTTQERKTTAKPTGLVPNGWNLLPLSNQQISQIDTGLTDQISALNSDGMPSLYINNVWVPIVSEPLSYITTGDSGIWAISKDLRVLFRTGVQSSYPTGTKWEKIGNDLFTKIDSGPKGYVFGIRSNGVAAYREGISKQLPFGVRWINLSRRLKSISVGTFGIWAVDEFGNLLFANRPSNLSQYRLQWRGLPGLRLKQVDAGFGNNVWGLTDGEAVFKRADINYDTPYGTFWESENFSLRDATVGLPGVFGIDSNGRIIARQDMTKFCGGILKAPSGRLQSPGYPFTSYPIGSQCLWIIRVPSAKRITLSVVRFDVFQSGGCIDDYLLLYERGHYSPENGVNKYCGREANISPTISFNGDEVWIQFKAGRRPGSSEPRGFDIRYSSEIEQPTARPTGPPVTMSTAPTSTPIHLSTETFTGCGGTLKTAFGSLISPGFPAQYSNNLRCIWTIEVDAAREITLKFDAFSLEEDLTCRFDFLLVKTSENNGRELGKFCGPRIPADVNVGGNKVWIFFKSDGTLNRRGFRLNWSSKRKSGLTVKPTTMTTTKVFTKKVTTKSMKPDLMTAPQIPSDWSKVLSNVKISHIDGGISPNAWAIDEAGKTYVQDGNLWRLVGSLPMKWITSGGSGAWAIDRAGNVYFRHGTAPLAPRGIYWDKVDSPQMEKIDSGPMGSVLAIDNVGNLLVRQGITPENPKGSSWKRIESGYRHLSVGTYGYWVVNNFNQVFFAPLAKSGQLPESFRWIPVSQRFDQVKAGFGSSLWAMTPEGDLYQRKGVTAIIPTGLYWKREGKLKINGVSAGMSGIFASIQGTNEIIKKSGNDCGAILTAAVGSFSTPNYPLNYPANTTCLWQIKVPGAKKVIVEFENFQMEPPNRNCNKDYLLYLRDGEFPSAYGVRKRCGDDSSPIIFEGDKAWIEFVSDDYGNFPGFKARYNVVMEPGRVTDRPLTPSLPATKGPVTRAQDLFTGCGGLIDASAVLSGQFAHPGYPGDYISSQTCEYIIRTVPGKRILLDFDLFDLEGTSDCRYDSFEIRDGELVTDELIGKYCGKRELKGIRSRENALYLKFKSDASSEFKGYYAKWRVENRFTTTKKPEATTKSGLEGPNIGQITTACGGTIDASMKTVGYIANPRYPEKYDNNLDCTYIIKTSPGKKMKLSFRKMSLESHDACRFDYIEIRDGGTAQASLLGRFCGQKKPSDITSNGDSLFIRFLSDYATIYDGFLIRWTVEIDNILPTVTPKLSTAKKDDRPITACGGNFRENAGLFATPNYPNDYAPRLDCMWRITVGENKIIQLTFEFFDIEKSSGACLYDYVEIFDVNVKSNAATSLGKYCDKMPKEIMTSGNRLNVVFHSDNVKNRKGFVARWIAQDVSLKTTPSAVTEKPCFQRLSGFGGEIIRGGLSSFYSPNQNCQWIITVNGRNRVKVEFDDFELESSPFCSKDSLKIYDGPSNISPTLLNACGTSTPRVIISSSNELSIRFMTDATNNARGFKLRWSAVQPMTDKPAVATTIAKNDGIVDICDTRSVFVFERIGVMMSPNFPREYPANRRCSKVIQTSPNNRIVVSFDDFAIEPSFGCQNDALVITDGKIVKNLCAFIIPSELKSSGNILRFDFKSDLSTQSRGFKLKWRTEPILKPSILPTYPPAPKCGGRVYGKEGAFAIQKFKRKYPFAVTCTWIIEVGPVSTIRMRYLYANIQEKECSSSYLLFRDGVSSNARPLKLFCKGHDLLPFESQGNTLYVELKVGANTDIQFGFLWKEQTVSFRDFNCGGIKTQSSGMITSPQFPSQYQNKLICTWIILAPKGHKIALDFSSFDLEEDSRCSKDYLAIRNGQTSYASLAGRYCGRSIPRRITSTGNSFWLQLQTDCKITNNGFKLNWRFVQSDMKTSDQPLITRPTVQTVAKTKDIPTTPKATTVLKTDVPVTTLLLTPGNTVNAQGGLITGRSGVIQSPSYPGKYPNNEDIVWVIKGPAAGRIALTFKSFSLEDDTSCRYDYVQFRDGPASDSPSIGKFCGNNLPATYTSAANALWVKFLSDSSENRLGFQVEWKWLPAGSQLPASRAEIRQKTTVCGGVLTEKEGKITTPNYPLNYPSNVDCVWLIKPVAKGRSIQLSFRSFSLEAESRCGYDFVELKDGESHNSPSLGRYCGSSLPRVHVSSGGVLFIRFKSDSSTNDQGFLASWKTVAKRGKRSIGLNRKNENIAAVRLRD